MEIDLEQKTFLDKLVNSLGDLMNRVGLNGTRLRWRWQNYRASSAESAAERDVHFRTVTAKHKMCPSCRSLIPSGSVSCPECGITVAHVRGPGLGRLTEWLMPGVAPVTATLVTVNLFVFGIMGAVAGFSAPSGGGFGALFSFMGFNTATLARFGLGYGPWVIYGEVWRMFTPLFIHAGILHILFNCFVLLQIGKLIEDEYGSTKTWVIYLVAGLCGGIASNFIRPILLFGRNVPYVGASGAIFGLIGLAMVLGWRRGGPYGNQLRRSMVQWTIYVLIFGLVVGADNFAHVGGLVVGGLLGLVVPTGPSQTASGVFIWRAAAWLGALVCVWAFVMAGLYGPESLSRVS